MKRIFALLLTLTIIASCFCSCSKSSSEYVDPTASIKVQKSTDKYRNYYEIFVSAFNDSDGDGVGDLRGIIDKLDYLNDGDPKTDTDLGIDGIWLTPIMPSPSYHKYDVDNYFDIDENFGTLDDFDELVTECHKRGINLIIDMVLNHCSSTNPLFKSACEQALSGNMKGDAEYFEIHKFDENPGEGYTGIGKNLFYESNFSEHMPEWNLNSDKTRDYFEKIAEFWLKKHKVDGFRLDATLYYTNDHTDGQAFLKWYYSMAQKYKSDVYMVGEHWTGNAEIEEMYNSGIDSFFAFGFAGSAGGFVNSVITSNGSGLAKNVKSYIEETKKSNPNAINSFFLSNHDQIRSGNYLSLRDSAGTKMAAALYMLMPGNSFFYYGEEIGTTQDATKNDDQYKREPMIWDSENLPDIRVSGAGADANHASYGGVKQQEKDKKSILNFYKRVIKVKNQNPAIARGKITKTDGFKDECICGYYVEYKGEKLLIVHNVSDELSKTVELSDDCELRADLVASEKNGKKHINLDGKKLKLLPYSTAVLKVK